METGRMSMYRRHLTQALCTNTAGGKDVVFTWAPLPARSTLRKIWLDYTIVGVTNLDFVQACLYNVQAYIIPIPDPDGSTPIADPNTLWDTMVPKDQAYGAAQDFDEDDTAVDTPVDDPTGEISTTKLFGASYQPEQIFDRLTMLTMAHPLSQQVSSTQWVACDRIKTTVEKNIYVERPSVVLFAIGTADFDATYDAFVDGTDDRQDWVPTSALEWNALSFPKEVMSDWWRQSLGLTDGVSAALINSLRRWAEQIYVATDGRIIDQSYSIIGDATYQVSAPKPPTIQLTSR